MSDASAEAASRRVSCIYAMPDVVLSQAGQADLPGSAESDSGFDAEAQQLVAVLHSVVLVEDQARGFFLVPRADIRVIRVHDRLVLLAEASSAEGILRAWSLVTNFEAPDADALLITLPLHGPAVIS